MEHFNRKKPMSLLFVESFGWSTARWFFVILGLSLLWLCFAHYLRHQKQTAAQLQTEIGYVEPDQVPAENANLNSINKELKTVTAFSEINREKLNFENLASRSRGNSEATNLPTPSQPTSVDLRVESSAEQVIKDLESETASAHRPTLTEKIDFNLANKQYLSAYDKQVRDEFVRQYVQNARKDGFIVSVNKDMQIVEIKKVKKPQDLYRVPQSIASPNFLE